MVDLKKCYKISSLRTDRNKILSNLERQRSDLSRELRRAGIDGHFDVVEERFSGGYKLLDSGTWGR